MFSPMRRPLLLLSCCALLTVPLAGQDWRGQGRAHGAVLSDDGEPLAGAEVRLVPVTGMGVEPAGSPESQPGPQPVTTGEDGEWSFPRLAPGAWWIAVRAEGFRPAQGWLRVPAEGPGKRTVVRLVDLDVVSPRFAEGDPRSTVRGWLESGDALLEQGRTAEARAEYEKALGTAGVLDAGQRAQVLETLARTHYLEGDVDAAVRALQAALVLTPRGSDGDERLRRLLTVLLEDRGRGAEVERFLARLEEEPDAVSDELADLLGPEEDRTEFELPERPTREPEPGRSGRYRVAFEQPSPLSEMDRIVERLGADRSTVAAAGGGYELSEETFEVAVPPAYEPGAGWGLLVWVSPGPYGGTERPETLEVLGEHRLIWVGANRSGNPRPTWDRIGLALDAAHAMTALYDLAPERIYVAGYSGGGRVASAAAMLYPEVFRGALSVMGCDFYRPVSIPHRPGTHWPASFPEPPAETLRRIRRESRFVLLTGERDFNRAQTRATFDAMREAGFRHGHYLEMPGADHYSGLAPEWLSRALGHLDRGDPG